jgi:hypothetical protein
MLSDLNLLGMANLLQQDFSALLNKCQREEIEAYPWSFLFKTVPFNAQPPIQTGLATATTGLNIVSFVGFTPQGVIQPGWWIWLGPTLTIPFVVNSVAPTTVQLSIPYNLPTIINSPYTAQPLYYDVSPLQTVFRVRQIDDLIETSQAELNVIDPSRIATGGAPSLRWANAPFDLPNAIPNSASVQNRFMVELWPRPTSALPYIADGKIGPVDMVNDSDLPMIPATVLEAKAMMYACRAVFASSGNPKWATLSEAYRQDYLLELEKVKQEDTKRITPKGITSWGGRRLFDASIDETHDLSGPPDYQAW